MQVPYNPVPNQSPQDISTPRLSVNNVSAAFGEGVGAAISHLGSQVERSSDELFNRAVALQELRNRSEGDEATMNLMIKTSKPRADFHSLQGRNAVDGQNAYYKTLQDMREQIRGTIKSPMAQRYYDSETRGFIGREIYAGAQHAATQNKIWAHKSAGAAIDPLRQQISQSPFDDKLFDSNMEKINAAVDAQVDLEGLGPEESNRRKALEQSQAIVSRVRGMAEQGQAFAARRYMEDNRDKIYSQHRDAAENFTQTHIDNAGAKSISDKVRAGWAPWMDPRHIDRAQGVDRSLQDVVKEAQADLEKQGIKVTIGGQGGKRTQEEQNKLVAEGRSKTYNSNHLYGRAIDLVPLGPDGKENYEDKAGYAKIDTAMKAAAEKLGVKLSDEHDKIRSWDPGHFSIEKGFDTGSVPTRPDPTEKQLVDRGVSYAKQLFPDNDLFHRYVESRIGGDYRELRRLKHDAEQGYINTIHSGLLGDLSEGKPPKSIDDLLSIPEVSEAYYNLEPKQRTAINAKVQNVQNAQRREDSETEGRRLRGMAEANVNSFLGEDILNNDKLSYPEMKSLLSLQERKRKQPAEKNPQVARALHFLAPKLNTIDALKDKKSDEYNMFIGTLQDVIVQHMKDAGGKPPNTDELKKIGNQLLYEAATKNTFLGIPYKSSIDPIYKQVLPPEKLEEARTEYMDKFPDEPPPDDESLQRFFRLKLYEEVWKGKKEVKPTGVGHQ